MAKTPEQIAEQVMPGWHAVSEGPTSGPSATPARDYDTRTPNLGAMRRKYKSVGLADGARTKPAEFVAAGPAEPPAVHAVILEPNRRSRGRTRRRVVIVSNGVPIAVQG